MRTGRPHHRLQNTAFLKLLSDEEAYGRIALRGIEQCRVLIAEAAIKSVTGELRPHWRDS